MGVIAPKFIIHVRRKTMSTIQSSALTVNDITPEDEKTVMTYFSQTMQAAGYTGMIGIDIRRLAEIYLEEAFTETVIILFKMMRT